MGTSQRSTANPQPPPSSSKAHLPTSKVVKAFNHIYAAALTTDGQPRGTSNRRALAIAGDDAAAKATIAKLIDEFGFDTVDIGPLKESGEFSATLPATVHVGQPLNCARIWLRPNALRHHELHWAGRPVLSGLTRLPGGSALQSHRGAEPDAGSRDLRGYLRSPRLGSTA